MNPKSSAARQGKSFDLVDVKLLAALQANARASLSELGRQLNLSQPAISQRVKRLEESGAIIGYHAELDPAVLGLAIRAVIRLRTTHAHLRACLLRFDELPEIVSVYRLTGEDCFLLHVTVADAQRLETIVDAIARFGPVTTALVLRRYPDKVLDEALVRVRPELT